MSLFSLYWFNKLLDFGLDSYDLFSDDILSVFFIFSGNIINTTVDFSDQFLTSSVCNVSDVLYFSDLITPRVVFDEIVSYFEISDEVFEIFSGIFPDYLYDNLRFSFDLYCSPAVLLSDVFNFLVIYDFLYYYSFSESLTNIYMASPLIECLSEGSKFTCTVYGNENVHNLLVVDWSFRLATLVEGYHAFLSSLKFFSGFNFTTGYGVRSFLYFDTFLSDIYSFLSNLTSNFVLFDYLTSSVNLGSNELLDFSSSCSLLFTDIVVSDLFLSDVSSSGIKMLFNTDYVLNDQISITSGSYVLVNFLLDDYVKLILSSLLRSKLVLDFSVVPIFVAYSNFSDVLDYIGFLFELGKGFERFGSKVIFVFYDLGFMEGGRSSGDRGVSVYVFDKEITGFSDVLTTIDGIYDFGDEEIGGSVVFSLEGVGEQREKRIDRIFHGGRVSGADVYVDRSWFHYNFDRDNSLVVGKGLVGEDVKVVLDNVFELDWVKIRLDLLKRAKYA